MRKKKQVGQTIIEVLIAIAVVSVVMITLASGLTFSVKNTAEAKYRAMATSLAQEAIEIYRRERSLLGWEAFQAEAVSGTYCFNELPSSTAEFAALTPDECTTTIAQVGTQFVREVTVTSTDTMVRLDVEITWNDGANERNVSVVQEFKQWEPN
jgi:type IV pilus modification protein PilV